MEALPQQQWITDFGQKVDLTARLREILLNYPEGTSILKELVQNADDAKASTVRFVLDHNQYAAGSLLSPQLAQFQGPALLAYNDGVFTEKDFESISRIGDSKKREQAGKTGRFGVGFNSVYHVTDLPGFVSGEHLVFFDPHCKYLPSISAANPGKKINVVAHPVNSKLADQVAPFHLFGCDTQQPYQGTLFRFPLRTQEQAVASTISKQVYTPAAISALFSDLKQEAALVLLFLKSVCSIEVLELQAGQREPQLLFSCSVANRTPELQRQRALFTAAVTAPADQQVAGTYQLELVLRDATAGVDRQQLFLVSQRRGPPQLLAMANDLSKQFQVPLIAWGAVAADITRQGASSGSSDGSSADAEAEVAPGRAFCFLPLPALTSLPVHINGFFELSSNRRDVWHGADMAGTGRLRAQWNEALLQLVVAPAYLELLTAAATVLGPGQQFNRLWPSCEAPEPWQGVVRQLYGHLPGKQLLWTAAEGGRWLSTQQCFFPDAACMQPDSSGSMAGADSQQPSGSVEQQQQGQGAAELSSSGDGSSGNSEGRSSSGFGPLGQALVQLGLPLAVLPGSVLAMMQQYLPEVPQQCKPSAARQAVKAHPDRIPALNRQQQLVPLLAYCLKDLDLSTGPTGGWLQQLMGLRLLPLSDGQGVAAVEVTVGSARAPQQLVFVVVDALEQALVQTERALLLDTELVGPALTTQLSLLASFDSCNLKHVTMDHLVNTFVPRILPAAWQHAPVVTWTAAEGSKAPVSWEWLQSLWQWLAAGRLSLQPLITSAWPLLPVLGSQLVPLQPLDQSTVVIPGADAWPAGMAELLAKLGVHVLDADGFELPVEMLRGHCVHSASGTGVAAALAAALKLSRQQQQQPPQSHQLEDAAGRLSAKERQLLRSFLLQPTWFAASANAAPVVTLRAVARQLPLYELANSAQLQQQQQQVDVAELAELEPVFVSLDGNCCLAPAGVSPAALSSSYVLASHDQEAALMVRYLGVQAPTAAHVYRTDILPKLSTFPQAVRDNAMLLMLRHLSDLQQQDRGFMQLLSQTPFLPSGKGNLHSPSQLYDPRSPELVALLDPDACFPAPAFCGDVSDAGQDEQQQRSGNGSGFSSLAVLQQLGLRSSAQLDTLVAAARYVEKVAADGDEDMAVARGKALLAFLNTESERLVGCHTAITSAAAAAMAAASSHSRSSSASSNAADSDSSGGGRQQQQRPNRPGQGLFQAMQRGLMGLGSKLQSFDQPGFTDGPTGSSNQQQQEQDAARAAQLIAQQWVQLSQLCWCPVLSEAPDAALPWRDGSRGGNGAGRNMQRLAAPCAVRPLKDLWLVSAVKAVVDGECQSQVALAGLGWNAPLTGAELGSQLSALGLKHRTVTDAHLAQQLARIVPQLYMALDALPSTELSAAAAVLEGQPSVWVGNGFVDASRVAFKGGMDLSPHLYVLPLELTPFMEVLAALGAQEAFSAAQYTTVLQDLATEAAGKPLQPKQLAQALGVAQALADVLGASGGGATAGKAALAKTAGSVAGAGKQADVVLVPDESGVMRSAADLALDDAPWLDGPTAAADGDLKLVHPRIAAPVAEALGVASRRRMLLAASADCLALGLAGAGGAVEAFGQSEALTTRLRHIIQDYPEGPGVLLELVQNADDAGATKAAFLLDMRQHGTSSLLGPGMAAWQGPALLAYNNAIFSPGDFSAIASIGQDGKMSQPAAIGRFGLGFNAVYHLTDLPSFVSGQHLVLFDPHARYLPGASAAQPGLRVNLQRGRLLQQFPDAFAPYMHFGCSMEGSYPGTLFRFPLRSDTTAATSNIKAQPTSPQQALQLLQSLTDVLPQALLFLKSLQEIEVYVVGDTGTPAAAAAAAGAVVSGTAGERDRFAEFGAGEGEPQLMFRASLKPLDGKDSLQTRITHFVSSGGGGSGAQQLDAFFRRLESVKEADLPCSMGKVQLSLSVSPTLLGWNSPVTAGVTSAGQQDLGLVAAVSAGDGAVKVVQEDWLVCNQLGGGAARAMALDAWRNEKVKMIPWVGVATHLATHVSVSGYSSGGRSLSCRSSTGGRAFCFLPLPADTCLPVHINGYFELSSNRRDVWHGDDMAGAGQRRARWNEALLESAVAPAYAALLQEASHLLGPCADLWRLLPLGQGSVPEPWLRVAAAVYARLADRPVLYSPVDGGRWLAPQQALLPDAACYSSTKTGRSTGDGLESSSSSSSSQAFADTQRVSRAQRSEDEVSGVAGTDSMLGYVPAPLQASVLAGLLVQCGVPLVMGLSEEQQRCMLQWAPNTAKVSPAKARQLLRTQPALVADTLSRHLRQQKQQGSSAQPAAAVVLQYCLSDAAATGAQPSSSSTDSTVAPQQQLLQALQQLNGLKLLPLADGQLQTIHAGLHTGISRAGGNSRHVEQFVDSAVYVTVSPQEQQLLQGLKYHMLHEQVGEGLKQQLRAVAAAGASNVHVLTAARFDNHILGLLLPSEWHSARGHVEVTWQPGIGSPAAQAQPQQQQLQEGVDAEAAIAATDTAAGGDGAVQQPQQQQQQQQPPSREYIQLCWRWLAERGDAADVSHWPLLPVTGGKLRLLQQPAQVLRAGDWTEQLMSALTKLGCCLLDTQVINFPCKALSAFVQEPTAAGLLDALAAAQAVSAAGQVQLLAAQQGRGAGLPVSVQARWQQQLQQLAPAERHHVRTYLLQAKWFGAAASGNSSGSGGGGSGSGEVGGFNQQQLQVLRSLPIFEVHPPLPYEVDRADSSSSGGTGGSSGGSSGGSRVQLQQQQDVGLLGLLQPTSTAPAAAAAVGTGVGLYRSLSAQGSQQQLLLPPKGITNGAVLGSQFLKCESESEEAVLTKHLGVRRLPMQEYLMLHLAKAPQQLEPRALISTVAYILSRLKDLSASEPDPPLSIKGLQVIPTRAGLGAANRAAAGAEHHHQQQQQQGWQQLVLAAPFELFDPSNPVLVQLLDARHFPAPPFDGTVDSRAAWGVTGAVAAAVEAKALLEALTLCGLRKELDLEVLLIAAQDIADLPLDDPSAQPRAQLLLQHLDKWAQQHPQPSPQEAELWKRLQTLPWCPVVVDPPEEGLPWTHAQQPPQQQQTQPQVTLDLGLDTPGEQQTQQQQQWVWRAAPKMVAPAEMAWLVSGPLRLLAAPSPGRQLCEVLGWSQQQLLRPFTASMQLAQLGEKYPAGTVDSPQLQSKLDKAATVLYSSLAPYVDDNDQMQLLQTNLLSTPCMWVGTGFAFPAVTALQAPSSSSSSSSQHLSNLQRLGSGGLVVSEEPGSNSSSDLASQLQQQRLLYLVPKAVQEDAAAVRTIQALHVPQHWDFAAYAIALAVLGERSANRALTQQELTLSLLLADAAAIAQQGTSSTRLLQQDHVIMAANVLKVAAAGPGGVVGTGGPDLVVVPDTDGVMAAPSELYFNDAAWLGAEGLRLAHAGLRQDTAEALGVRSMRLQHQSSESLTKAISCPTVDAAAAAAAIVISSCIQQHHEPSGTAAAQHAAHTSAATAGNTAGSQHEDCASLLGQPPSDPAAAGPALTALLSILKWADGLCAAGAAAGGNGHARRGSSAGGVDGSSEGQRYKPVLSFNVVLDERQHGTQSLLHSGLSRLQGPALCVTVKGISSLPADKLGQLLTLSGSSAGTLAAQRMPAGAAPAGGSPGSSGSGVAAAQQGLASAWAVTDVVQAMSGDTTCYWDPSGQALAQTVKEMRQQAPRGRSIKHTQPDLAQHFAHQWAPWSACTAEAAAVGQPPRSGSSDGSSGGSSGSSGSHAAYVADALYLRLPLRLQDQRLQGSVIAAAAGARLGLASRAVGLSLDIVRRQVAAFGPAAARSLLFLGHIQSVSVSTWPADSPAAVKLWQASLSTAQTASGSLRVGTIAQQQLAKYRDKGASGPGGLLARIASGARGLGGSGKQSHKECWRMTVSTQYAPAALQQLSAGQQLHEGGKGAPGIAGPQQPQGAQQEQAQEQGTEGQHEQLQAATVAVDGSVADAADVTVQLGASLDATSSAPADTLPAVCRDSYNWLASLACEVHAPPEPAAGSAGVAAAVGSTDPVLNIAAVAVCTSFTRSNYSSGSSSNNSSSGSSAQAGGSMSGFLPAGGVFGGVALPGKAGGIFGQQQLLIDVQGTAAAAVLAPGPTSGVASAASPVSLQQQHHQQQQPGVSSAAAAAAGATGRRVSISDGQLDARARASVSVLVSAWHEMFVVLKNAGAKQQLYSLMPDLLAAVAAGNAAAAFAFKQVYQDAATMPIWQLRSGACVHIQEGAFLPPKCPPTQPGGVSAPARPAAAAAAASVAGPVAPQQAGLGEEAREFVMQQLPLFQVPWPLVAQLEAAGVTGLRIISPAVLRPLLRAQQPKSPHEAHPFVSLTATQALQLLEYCCSDLTAPDERRSSSSGDGSSKGTPGAAPRADASSSTPGATETSQQATGRSSGERPAVDVASVQAALPANIPQGAANVVADVFGPVGLAVLGGLASQMQQRLVTGVDDVLNAVMDAMGTEQEQQQQQQQQRPQPQASQHAAAAFAASRPATPPARTEAVAAPAYGSRAGVAEDPAQAVSPVNMNKVPYLRGLPVPTAGGTIAMLGVASLYVFPPECSPAPTALMPAHLLRQFVLPDCMEALAWLFKYPEVRQQLRLTFYGLDQLAGHLKEALGPTWSFADTARGPTGGLDGMNASMRLHAAGQGQYGAPAQRATAACMPGTPGFPAVVAWDDGAAGGPYHDWLVKLWRVILQTVAAQPEWERRVIAGLSTANAASNSSGSNSSMGAGGGFRGGAGVSSGLGGSGSGFGTAGMADGIRNAAQRARGLAEAFAGEVAQALNVPGPSSNSASTSRGFSGPTAAGPTPEQEEADALWRPLLDWPLLPLADGRLLKLRYRELALAVLPEYQQRTGSSSKSLDASDAEVQALHEPWGWLLPALCAAGQPVLDPRFNFLIDSAASSSTGIAVATPAASPTAAAGTSVGAVAAASAADAGSSAEHLAVSAYTVPPVPALPVQVVTGLQPMIGRPPFLGPFVHKLAATEHTLGGLDWSCSSSRTVQQLSTGLRVQAGPWDDERWTQLFNLLADHPPRDLQPDGVQFLRGLPMYRPVPQSQQQQQGYGQHVQASGAGDPGSTSEGDAKVSQLVALGSSTDWVLAPAAVLQACAGLRALASLPVFSTDRILEHRPGWGELYDILGVEPANLAQLLQVLLLPYLQNLTPQDRLMALEFLKAHWTQSRQYSSPLSTVSGFAAALKEIAFVPAAQPAAGSSSSSSDGGGQDGTTLQQQQQQQQQRLYKPAELFDPSVPLFAAVMATMATAAAATTAGSESAGLPQVLFPAAPFNRDEWLRFLRDLGLQHRVTKETFLQLAQHVAQQAAALAQHSTQVTAPVAASSGSSSSSSSSRAVSTSAAGGSVENGALYLHVTGAEPQQLQTVQAAADALLGHLRSHWTGLGQDRPFWQALGSVPFWPATLGVPGSRQARQVFAPATAVAQYKDWPLVWSVQPLLQPQREPTQTLRQQLGMRSPPPLSAVLQHLQTVGQDGGEDLLASWPDSIEPFINATLSILQHLDKEGLSPQQALQLSGAAFIPVAHAGRLVAPQQLFLKLGGAALAPFAWEVPGQFVAHGALLKSFGVQDEPRAEDLVHALWRFAGQLAGRRMNPNELAACMRVLSYLSSRAVSSADASFLTSARRSNKLLVPTAGAQLMPASRVVHMGGAGGSMTAARLLGRTDPQQLVLAHPQLPEHVCRWLGVPALSECLVEELDPATSDLTPLAAIGTVQLAQLRTLLSSPAFASAAFSIAAAHATAVPALRQLDLGSVTRLCAAAGQGGRLRFVRKLATNVVLRGSKEDVTRSTASREVYEFYEQPSDSAALGTLYVAVPPPGLPLSALLAQVLSRALGCPFTLPLHPLLEVPDATQLSQLQPVLHAGGYDSELEGALAAGHVGSPLQPGDRALLRLRPLRHYEAGELVAVKRRLSAAATALPGQAAAAAADARASTADTGAAAAAAAAAAAGGAAGGDEGGMVLCYGRVAVDAAPQPGQAAYRLTVEVAPGAYESILSTQVFCFQSGAQHTQRPAGATDSAASAEPSAATAGASSGSAASAARAAGAGADAPSPAAATQQASELASAVADMLSAAGMPLDLDKQQLLQAALAANAQLQQASAAVAELRQEAARKESELEAARSNWQCRVCFSRDVEQAFVGCGHMYCGDCMPSLAKCPVCRKSSQKIRLYR